MPTQHRTMTTGRNILAIGACGVVACLSVSLISFILAGATAFMNFDRTEFISGEQTVWTQIANGVQLAMLLGLMNFVLFFITVPAAWLALGFTLGRKPRKGIANASSYYRDAMIWGALLVGLTTGVFGAMDDKLIVSTAAGVTGAMIGASAGAICAFVYLLIVKPTQLYTEPDASVFD